VAARIFIRPLQCKGRIKIADAFKKIENICVIFRNRLHFALKIKTFTDANARIMVFGWNKAYDPRNDTRI
jgi:hypothetical protein